MARERKKAGRGHEAPLIYYRPKHPRQELVSAAWPKSKAILITGPAGTGKTTCALGLAMADIIHGRSKEIWLCRPAVADGEHLGYVKGDMEEKLGEWMGPFMDALDILGGGKLEDWSHCVSLIGSGMLGGRNVRHGTLIIDECQNAKECQIKRALTRPGEGGRIVLCGDYSQSQLPSPNPLEMASIKLRGMDEVASVEFLPEDQQRSQFVQRVLEALR